MLKKQNGLTLIELLAVIAIIAILFVLLIPQVNNAIKKSKEVGILNDFRSYQLSINSFYLENDRLPSNLNELNSVLSGDLKFENKGVFVLSKKNIPTATDSSTKNYVLQIDSDYLLRIYAPGLNGVHYNLYFKTISGELIYWTNGLSNELNAVKKQNSEYEYTVLDNREISIDNYIGTSKEVAIPPTIDGLPVTIIANTNENEKKAFFERALTSVTLPDTLQFIGYAAFYKNELTELTIPSSVKIINGVSFKENEINTLILNEGLEIIKNAVFYDNEIIKVRLPKTTKSIGDSVFIENPMTEYEVPPTLEFPYITFPEGASKKTY